MDSIARAYQSAWEELVKPRRVQYWDEDIGPEVYTSPGGDKFYRQKFEIMNPRG